MDNKVLDEAVEVAKLEWRKPEHSSPDDAFRAALIAGMRVLQGEPVGWQYLSDGKWISVGEPMANVFANHGRVVRRVYAPSLGEGDGR